MFENLSLHELQIYWWVIISLLGGLFVFIMFVQGGQTLLRELSENETEKTMLVNSLGRKWELGFTTLVLFGGALFAAFPLFYATSFGGAYWVWLAILFTFIVQAVSYEYRAKPSNIFGAKTYETFLAINGYLGTFLLGTAISTFFSGADFRLDEHNFVHWMNPTRGLEALLVWQNYLLPFAMIFLVRIIGGMYFLNNIDHEPIHAKTRAMIKRNIVYFLPFFLSFAGWVLFKEGYAYDPVTKAVFLVPMKHLMTFIELPWIGAMFLIGVVMVLIAVFNSVFRAKNCCIFTVGAGTVLAVMALLLNVGLNGTSYYPSVYDLQHSLTIENSSGSHYTLTAMSYASLMVPFVLAYIAYVWHLMDRVKITEEEITSSGEHHY
ncbi:cytochrome bd quinol oxidase subunit 2 apoprotein [Sulfuricurvum kujiense DSM 16994]|uniref:Cytochrome bd quinol oxidase subunit 2 apoprotein n=1 Tax=Sulfuricurvum kujiense (strain ATCC BAA-921 / DSM 16994 / JCM 11577 / YK-1) TaxID=709032 RepID=E4U2I8_SULKY|nr:cytochrome d ubiquinol oxidase subunit II [Sulfuricurvum kujiense]ADR34675.1 cytochrome bd quinol oxidase subunit 2 apoprotein [Sulfuricurvum kujiense DSM 16994]